MNSIEKKTKMDQAYIIEFPGLLRKAFTPAYWAVILSVTVFMVISEIDIGIILIIAICSSISYIPIFLYLKYRIVFDDQTITFQCFPLKTKTVSWNEIELNKRRASNIHFTINDQFGKRLGAIIHILENSDRFFKMICLKRPDLFALPEDGRIKKRLYIYGFFVWSFFSLIAIIVSIPLTLNPVIGIVLTVIYVFVMLFLLFKGILEIRIEEDMIYIKRAFSEKVYLSDEIESIGLIRNTRKRNIADVAINLKNKKSIRVNLEGQNMLILYNQLALWLENQQAQQENTPY